LERKIRSVRPTRIGDDDVVSTKAMQSPRVPGDDSRWHAVMTRDAAADGRVYYSVSTTGVFCRPSCWSRRPRREHVRFHASAAEALRAGYRPCLRCRPTGESLAQTHVALVTNACALLDSTATPVRLATLAAQAGLSPYHFHRLFKRVTGVTPREFADARRRARLDGALKKRGRITDAIYDAGFGSAGHFYGKAAAALGMTPRQYRSGGENMEIQYAVSRCSLGHVLVAQSTRGVCAILLGDDAGTLVRDLEGRFPRARLVLGRRALDASLRSVVGHLNAPESALELPLDVRGTAFQQRVWRALRDIAPGTTRTYADIARVLDQPTAARAVAAACAANPLAVAVPCHRVVRGDGSLAGYRWGVDRKKELLRREASRHQ
jgi:AraC family transcriptional regulator of adaptative response/methylated-DNA-[protein]-cysteine methyltransferase